MRLSALRSAEMDYILSDLAKVKLKASVRLALEEAASMLALLAMSFDQAKQVLGFPPEASPTTEEVQKAWKKLAMQHHPDRGGDQEKMKEVNVAKDILEGKQRPDRLPPPPSPGAPPPTSYGRPDSPPKKHVVTIEEATRPFASQLDDVEWLFRTDRQKSKGTYYGDESSKTDMAYAAVGKKPDGSLIILGLRNETYEAYFVGGGAGSDVWTAKLSKADGSLLKNPASLTSKVKAAISSTGFGGVFNHKVVDAQGAKLLDMFKRGITGTSSTMSLKNWLVQSGQVEGNDPSVASRKMVIEIAVPRGPHEDDTTTELIVNGKKEKLSFSDEEKMRRANAFGAIFGPRYDYGAKKSLTRLKNGKKIMTWMLAKLTDISKEAREALTKAIGDPAV
jgi:hypothetical protein